MRFLFRSIGSNLAKKSRSLRVVVWNKNCAKQSRVKTRFLTAQGQPQLTHVVHALCPPGRLAGRLADRHLISAFRRTTGNVILLGDTVEFLASGGRIVARDASLAKVGGG